MPLVCRLCSRHNPAIAQFCWYDGVALDHAGGNVALPAGARPFPMPFVFPSGRNCGNFDELVLGCESSWPEAQQLLAKGHLATFLGGVGRSDLALAADRAARHADPDQGLDDLLGRFPATARTPALLVVDPPEINLGQLNRSAARVFSVHIENGGMGLLKGSLTCDDTPWLALGDVQGGSRQKLFQTRVKQTFNVHVNVKALPASDKRLEGRLLIESNGGTTILRVLAEPVPVQPFADGVLAGSRTPRQLAEKAKAHPHEASLLFERGAVAAWYANNGWVYPVQAPASSGLAAVQQFFEALGLVKPPKVEISPLVIDLSGAPGATLSATLLAHTLEKRAVWANATTDAPWLQTGRAVLDGRTARLPLVVPAVPAMPGSSLEADVNITANGNQCFTVRVRLMVSGRSGSSSPGLNLNQTGSVGADAWFLAPNAQIAPVHASLAAVAAPLLVPTGQVKRHESPSPPASPSFRRPQPVVESPVLLLDPYSAPAPQAVRPAPAPHAVPVARGEHATNRVPLIAHLAPLGILLLALFVVGLHDLFFVRSHGRAEPAEKESAEEVERRNAEDRKREEDKLATEDKPALIDPKTYLQLAFHTRGMHVADVQSLDKATMRFGIKVIRDDRGEPLAATRTKRLVFHELGGTNNTCLRIDDKDYLFGSNNPGGPGRWVEQDVPLSNDRWGNERIGARSIWQIPDAHVFITQEVEVVASGVRANEKFRRRDTCLITYSIENKDTQSHKVGLRFLLDTFIGENDGVPFLIPGKQLCSTSGDFYNEEVPDYLEAYENNDLANPGTVARLTLRVSEHLEAPGRVILGGWPNPGLQKLARTLRKPMLLKARGNDTLWDVPVIKISELHDRNFVILNERGKEERAPADSAVTMYWGEQDLAPGKKRHVGFAYGLGSVSAASPNSKMLLTLGRPYEKRFTATALVLNPIEGETLTLTLPDGLKLVDGELNRSVPAVPPDAARQISTVTWSVRAERPGEYEVTVRSSRGFTEKQTVTVRATDKKSPKDAEKGLFD